MLGDCVAFLLRWSKISRQIKAEPMNYVLHSALLLLHKYTIKLGLKAALIDQDRLLVALACLSATAKANSQFVRTRDLIEFYHYNKPLPIVASCASDAATAGHGHGSSASGY